ncbi:MAG: hypothetical protein FWE80_01865, partial [Oscillospiraceae bacterium]|nr:hypothetical protein [Oscillospiraceae bacterium]
PLNNLTDKSVVGYQMWFQAGNASGGWVHWSGRMPREDNGTSTDNGWDVEQFPYIADYNSTSLRNTSFPDLPDGRKAQLFSSVDPHIVDTHLGWMKESGMECFAIQRFFGGQVGASTTRIAFTENAPNLKLCRRYAEKHDRIFYVMYDLNGYQSRTAEHVMQDWYWNIERQEDTSQLENSVLYSPNYAQMPGKNPGDPPRPVVCLWGTTGDYMKHDDLSRLVDWFQNRGIYVIAGTPDNDFAKHSQRDDETLTEFNNRTHYDINLKYDMISPWMVGRYNGSDEAARRINNDFSVNDVGFCEANGIDYMPVVFAGSAWCGNMWGPANDFAREAGEFLWTQAATWKTKGVTQVYFAMFDEYDEGTAIMPAARDSFDVPTGNQYFLTYAADGSWMDYDYYMRLCGEITKMMRDEVPWSETVQIPLAKGPLYFRNSYEQRWYKHWNELRDPVTNQQMHKRGEFLGFELAPIDPCIIEDWHALQYLVDVIEIPGFDKPDYIYENYRVGMECEMHYITGEPLKNQPYPVAACLPNYIDSKDGSTSPVLAEAVTGRYALQYEDRTLNEKAFSYIQINDVRITVPDNLIMRYQFMPYNEQSQYVFLDLLFSDGTLLSERKPAVMGKKGTVGEYSEVTVSLDQSLKGMTVSAIILAYDGAPVQAGNILVNIDDLYIEAVETDKDLVQAVYDLYSSTVTSPDAFHVKTLQGLNAALTAAKSVLEMSAPTAAQLKDALAAMDLGARKVAAIGKLLGDVDQDGEINITDARLLLQFLVGKIDLDIQQQDNACVTRNPEGKITISDARVLLQFLVDKVPQPYRFN